MTAKKLSEAALHKDYELERFHYSRLVDSCQTCHTQFATDKFPRFPVPRPSDRRLSTSAGTPALPRQVRHSAMSSEVKLD